MTGQPRPLSTPGTPAEILPLISRTFLLPLLASLCLALTSPASEFGTVPDPFTGNWAGTRTTAEGTEPLHAAVIAGKGQFNVTFRATPDPRAAAIVSLSGRARGNTLVLESSSPAGPASAWQGRAEGDQLSGSVNAPTPGTFALRKVPFTPSATLGLPAPAGATVLFDGRDLRVWESRQNPADPVQWIVSPNRALEVVSIRDGKRSKQDLKTREEFGDYCLHVEFNLAYKPEATGQGRSNSGVIHHGVYETQILDSFGLTGRDNECGGIYKTREPDQNACFPPGLWQTYDFEVRAPRFDASGQKTAEARMTVRLNGIMVHNDVVVPKPTAGGTEAARGPIVLQDHGNPVQFRNIWVVKLD